MLELDKISIDVAWEFEEKFDGCVLFDMCYGSQPCYSKNKTEKSYLLENLTADQIEALMKKSLAEGHDYLLDAVKDNELPPYDPNLIY